MKQVLNAKQTVKQFLHNRKITKTAIGALASRILKDDKFPDDMTHWKQFKQYLYPDIRSPDVPNCARVLWWNYAKNVHQSDNNPFELLDEHKRYWAIE